MATRAPSELITNKYQKYKSVELGDQLNLSMSVWKQEKLRKNPLNTESVQQQKKSPNPLHTEIITFVTYRQTDSSYYI